MTHEIRVDSGEFAKALQAVLPHAGTDDVLPAMEAVTMTIEGDKRFVLYATDRYTLAEAVVPILLPENPEPFTVSVAPRDAKALLSVAKRAARKEIVLRVSVSDADDTIMFDFLTETSIYPARRELLSSFPLKQIKMLLRDARKRPAEKAVWSEIDFTAEFLARFAVAAKAYRVARGSPPALRMQPGTTAIANVLITLRGIDTFTGLIVPVRQHD